MVLCAAALVCSLVLCNIANVPLSFRAVLCQLLKSLCLCVLFRIIRSKLKEAYQIAIPHPLKHIGASARQLVAHLACIIRALVRTSPFLSSFGVIVGTSSGKSRLSSESYPLRWDSLLGAVFFPRLLPFSFCLLSTSFFLASSSEKSYLCTRTKILAVLCVGGRVTTSTDNGEQ